MEDIQFSNMDNWKGSGQKFGLTYPQIVLMHINRCVMNGSVEWHGGYWNETGHNPTVRHYVQNSREVYCNSVKMLRALLLGYYDKKIEERDNELFEIYNKTSEEFDELEKKRDSKDMINDWNKFKIKWHIELFEELLKLSKRLNFFQEESADEEI